MDISSLSEFDPFSTLGVERRPWLSAESIHTAFRERARQLHPDAPNGSASEFAQLTAARDLVLHPSSRLKHLVAMRPGSRGDSEPANSPLAADLGFEIASTIRQAEQLLIGADGKSGLDRALAIHAIKSCDHRMEELETRTDQLLHNLESDTRALDAVWPERCTSVELISLSHRWQYAQRWHDQVRRARFKLRSWLPLRENAIHLRSRIQKPSTVFAVEDILQSKRAEDGTS
jgi:hypothetical protein